MAVPHEAGSTSCPIRYTYVETYTMYSVPDRVMLQPFTLSTLHTFALLRPPPPPPHIGPTIAWDELFSGSSLFGHPSSRLLIARDLLCRFAYGLARALEGPLYGRSHRAVEL